MLECPSGLGSGGPGTWPVCCERRWPCPGRSAVLRAGSGSARVVVCGVALQAGDVGGGHHELAVGVAVEHQRERLVGLSSSIGFPSGGLGFRSGRSASSRVVCWAVSLPSVRALSSLRNHAPGRNTGPASPPVRLAGRHQGVPCPRPAATGTAAASASPEYESVRDQPRTCGPKPAPLVGPDPPSGAATGWAGRPGRRPTSCRGQFVVASSGMATAAGCLRRTGSRWRRSVVVAGVGDDGRGQMAASRPVVVGAPWSLIETART